MTRCRPAGALVLLTPVLMTVLLVACSGSDDAASTAPPSAAPPTVDAANDAGSVVLDLPTAPVDDDDQGVGPPRSDELGPPTMPRPCLMVDDEQVTELTGAVVVGSNEGVLRGVTTCFVKDAADEKIVSLALGPPDGFDEAAGTSGAEPVEGLGDGAVLVDGVLHVLYEQEHMAVKLYAAAGVDDASAPAILQALAAGAIERYIPPPPDVTTP